MSASAPRRWRTFSLRLKAALLVKVRARISSALALPSCTSHRMRSAITDVLPAPAPATRNRGVRAWVMARCCSGVATKGRSGIGLDLEAVLDGDHVGTSDRAFFVPPSLEHVEEVAPGLLDLGAVARQVVAPHALAQLPEAGEAVLDVVVGGVEEGGEDLVHQRPE